RVVAVLARTAHRAGRRLDLGEVSGGGGSLKALGGTHQPVGGGGKVGWTLPDRRKRLGLHAGLRPGALGEVTLHLDRGGGERIGIGLDGRNARAGLLKLVEGALHRPAHGFEIVVAQLVDGARPRSGRGGAGQGGGGEQQGGEGKFDRLRHDTTAPWRERRDPAPVLPIRPRRSTLGRVV